MYLEYSLKAGFVEVLHQPLVAAQDVIDGLRRPASQTAHPVADGGRIPGLSRENWVSVLSGIARKILLNLVGDRKGISVAF